MLVLALMLVGCAALDSQSVVVLRLYQAIRSQNDASCRYRRLDQTADRAHVQATGKLRLATFGALIYERLLAAGITLRGR